MYRGGYRGGSHGGRKKPGAPAEGWENRIRVPRDGEVFGVVTALLGGSRMRVDCKDSKERICRIPGKLRNRIWVKEGDVVIVEPWEIEGDSKGDIVWRYLPLQVRVLRDRGILSD